MIKLVFAALAFCVSALPADFSSLYDTEKLKADGQHLRDDLNLVIAQEITPFLTVEQLHAFSRIELATPASATPDANPLDFYSSSESSITIPLMTIAFVEDMAQAYSWLWANHYSSRTVDEYLGMLRERRAGDFPNQRYPSPLVALHIPANAMADPAVAAMTKRVRGTTLSFILLHQMGHLSYVPSSEDAAMRRNRLDGAEQRADGFALEVMKKNSETPAGLLMLIHGMMYLPAAPPKDHPLSEVRLKAMADFLDGRVREFSEGRPDRQLARIAIESLAGHIRQSAKFMSDPTGQELWAEQGRKTTVADLAPRQLAEHR